MHTHRRRALPIALLVDAIIVVAFVAIGRQEHDGGSALRDIAVTASPFLFGLLAGWLAGKVWRRPTAVATGLLIWPAVLVVGMFARRWVLGDGTALAFVIVATCFLGVGLVGWRAFASAVLALDGGDADDATGHRTSTPA